MKTKSPVHAFRESRTIDKLPENLQTTSYLIPMVVKDMGQLIGLEADARHIDWDADTLERETRDAYQQLASETALLLHLYGVDTISEAAAASVSHPLAANVDPLVSLHARVDHLFRAHTQLEHEHVRADVEKLWAALEFRCEAVTGQTFAQVLAED
jgi:hypothetical protein